MNYYRRCFLEKGSEKKVLSVLETFAKLGNFIDGRKITAVGKKINYYKVFIPTAGKGSRLGSRMTYFNKTLIKIADKAVISHTIDAFPTDTEFVIALGYKGDIVKQYLELTYPERKFTFVWSEKYMGEPGSGPGRAILDCEQHLQCPFYYVSCDAIVDLENRLHNQMDWAGTADIDDWEIKDYCTVEVKSDGWGDYEVVGYHNKSPNGTNNAFTGVAFINNFQFFWERMKKEGITEQQEIQVSPSILSIPNISSWYLDWWDTGTEEGIQKAREHFKGLQNLDKPDEEIYFVNNTAVKYFHNDSSIRGRIARNQLLGNAVPKLLGYTKNYYKYEFVEGQDLSTVENIQDTILPLLSFSKKHLWEKIELDEINRAIFRNACLGFYYQKTLTRLNNFYDKSSVVDREDIINGQSIPKVEDIFKLIDWDWISDGFPCIGHGDLNLSNVLFLRDNSFKLIDFRQDFGGLVDKFDAYYDFAKLYCSFLLPRQSANDGKFSVVEKDGLVDTNIEIPETFQKSKEIFEKWIIDEGFDLKKVKVLTAIVFLNMAALHSDPLNKYLFYFAKQNLYNEING